MPDTRATVGVAPPLTHGLQGLCLSRTHGLRALGLRLTYDLWVLGLSPLTPYEVSKTRESHQHACLIDLKEHNRELYKDEY
jgi:hypothetical protein